MKIQIKRDDEDFQDIEDVTNTGLPEEFLERLREIAKSHDKDGEPLIDNPPEGKVQ